MGLPPQCVTFWELKETHLSTLSADEFGWDQCHHLLDKSQPLHDLFMEQRPCLAHSQNREHLDGKRHDWCAGFSLSFFFFSRKISPELTTASLPLFAEEDWP